jgi:hypothetical protein
MDKQPMWTGGKSVWMESVTKPYERRNRNPDYPGFFGPAVRFHLDPPLKTDKGIVRTVDVIQNLTGEGDYETRVFTTTRPRELPELSMVNAMINPLDLMKMNGYALANPAALEEYLPTIVGTGTCPRCGNPYWEHNENVCLSDNYNGQPTLWQLSTYHDPQSIVCVASNLNEAADKITEFILSHADMVGYDVNRGRESIRLEVMNNTRIIGDVAPFEWIEEY